MRNAFFNRVEELSSIDESVFILTGDLGFKLFDSIRAKCSDRFYDIGVAEANMIGIAAGLSLSGKNVYCYSIIPFLLMRPFEQIRVDIAYHNLNVKLVGVGGGFTYGLEGYTHFGLEDIALMRSLPNMTIVVPADSFEAKLVASISSEYSGPMYIRLGRSGEPKIHETTPSLEIGKAMVLKEGTKIALFATGNMVYVGQQVVKMLEKKGINATIVNIHTIKPLDTEIILQIASTHEAVFSLEEHNISGGLGSAISEVLAESAFKGIFKRFGINNKLIGKFVGSADFLREKQGLTPQRIYRAIMEKI